MFPQNGLGRNIKTHGKRAHSSSHISPFRPLWPPENCMACTSMERFHSSNFVKLVNGKLQQYTKNSSFRRAFSIWQILSPVVKPHSKPHNEDQMLERTSLFHHPYPQGWVTLLAPTHWPLNHCWLAPKNLRKTDCQRNRKQFASYHWVKEILGEV